MMRAKSVYENINFQRGRDPIDAMGIGLPSIKDLGPLNKRPVHVWKKGDGPFQISRGYLLWKLLNFIKKRNDAGIPVGYADCVRYYYGQWGGQPGRRTFGMGVTDSVDRYVYRVEKNKYMLNSQGKKYLEDYSFFDDGRETLREGFDFQRGEDPKQALGIGAWRDGYIVENPGQYDDLHTGISHYIEFNNYSWSKKEFDPDDIRQTEITRQIEEEISKLPELSFKGYRNSGNILGLLDEWPEDFKYRDIPFVAKVLEEDGRIFVVDPEGYSYARYITEII